MELVTKVKNSTWSDGTDWDLKPLSLCHKNQSVLVVLDGHNDIFFLKNTQVLYMLMMFLFNVAMLLSSKVSLDGVHHLAQQLQPVITKLLQPC